MNIKTFEIDWDDYSSLDKMSNALKSRLGELKGSSRRAKNKQTLNACLKIQETDITHLYSTFQLDVKPIYYVYFHLDPTTTVSTKYSGKAAFNSIITKTNFWPFYVGKGTGNRCFDINRNETHRKVKQKINALGKEIIIIKIVENLTELEALCLESKLIDIYGLIPHGGKLTNLDEGLMPETRRQLYINEWNLISLLNRGISNRCDKKLVD